MLPLNSTRPAYIQITGGDRTTSHELWLARGLRPTGGSLQELCGRLDWRQQWVHAELEQRARNGRHFNHNSPVDERRSGGNQSFALGATVCEPRDIRPGMGVQGPCLGDRNRPNGAPYSNKVLISKVVFVQGESSTVPPIGLGVPPSNQTGMHMWLDVQDSGFLDISPKLTAASGAWRSYPVTGLAFGDLWPPGRGNLRICKTSTEYEDEDEVAIAGNRTNQFTAVYLLNRLQDFDERVVRRP